MREVECLCGEVVRQVQPQLVSQQLPASRQRLACSCSGAPSRIDGNASGQGGRCIILTANSLLSEAGLGDGKRRAQPSENAQGKAAAHADTAALEASLTMLMT